MVLKITTGNKKGITVASTKSARELRPTQSMVREAIINMVKNFSDFENLKVLDLYAGVGTMGLEFLSNDSEQVCFIEKDPKCIRILRSNIKELAFAQKSKVIAKPVLEGLKQLAKQGESYDLIFADPPYKNDDFAKVAEQILKENLLNDDALFIWEFSIRGPEAKLDESHLTQLDIIKEKRYGDTLLRIFRKSAQ